MHKYIDFIHFIMYNVHSGENFYMKNLIQMNEVNNDNRIYIGAQLFLEITKGYPTIAYLYVNQELIKKTNLDDKIEVRLLVVDAVERGAKRVSLANALGISRQTIHNYYSAQIN
jgi:hypothetical protein